MRRWKAFKIQQFYVMLLCNTLCIFVYRVCLYEMSEWQQLFIVKMKIRLWLLLLSGNLHNFMFILIWAKLLKTVERELLFEIENNNIQTIFNHYYFKKWAEPLPLLYKTVWKWIFGNCSRISFHDRICDIENKLKICLWQYLR